MILRSQQPTSRRRIRHCNYPHQPEGPFRLANRRKRHSRPIARVTSVRLVRLIRVAVYPLALSAHPFPPLRFPPSPMLIVQRFVSTHTPPNATCGMCRPPPMAHSLHPPSPQPTVTRYYAYVARRHSPYRSVAISTCRVDASHRFDLYSRHCSRSCSSGR